MTEFFGTDCLETAIDNFDDISFDTYNFCQYIQDNNSLPYMVYKIFSKYDFYFDYNISI